MKFEDSDYPALYRSADNASLKAQRRYFGALWLYLILLILAAFISYYWPQDNHGAMLSAGLFFTTLMILIWIKAKKPDDAWYNCRSVAESVKTRTWRWIMMAEPYNREIDDFQARRTFLSDLKSILDEHQSLSNILQWTSGDAISSKMICIRELSWQERLKIYKIDRVENQAVWYAKKSKFNEYRSILWFIISIIFHSVAILMLLYRINEPNTTLPIEVIATAAGAVLTWTQSKKYSELNSSYTLAAHEIILVRDESELINNENDLSEFVLNSESAFSREHTQWIARKK